MNFIQTEMTWPQGMKGMENGMVPIKISNEDIVSDEAERLSHQTCPSRRGMEHMTSGMHIIDCIDIKKGSSN
ncbi:MAG: hypothetical protein ACD_7C00215G0005 [uncultured bacterium]|nr:MAG: hypothetical protein ACD_7C00215G0005 [uncultured bacterium]KKP67591.1 MAG: hypothetical protein UR65_C0068G0004 [Candidatus Moranbacteria bacterium GW2011_GWE2_35_164]KKP68699.1 MAG: hypothetical protein UR66_C0004G0099 [Candidatus Moranbacteria bacterium GW2011_GWE1_35_17]KKP82763.1 MAG: hypothetical protein UR83_C0046G0007 [Candidatus Moranbacteria bacterium GW2011_GWF2_35_54]KKP83955.1 MAG: hypothetical protein UR82_C0015G0007 [Candidatus Moranbacteria bacterium GW2011_GWF1_35_5]HB